MFLSSPLGFVMKSLYQNSDKELQSSSIFVRHFVCPSSTLSELSIIFNFIILHSILLFCTDEIALTWD